MFKYKFSKLDFLIHFFLIEVLKVELFEIERAFER